MNLLEAFVWSSLLDTHMFKVMTMIVQVEILSTRLHSSINLVGLALGNPLLSPKIQFKFSEMAQVQNYDVDVNE